MRILIFTCVFLLVSAQASAFNRQAHKLGVGIELGDPTGLTAKYYIDRNLALQGGLGVYAWPFGPGGHVDVLYEIPNATNTAKQNFDLPLYIGGGIKVGGLYRCRSRRGYLDTCWYDNFAGLRVPLGAALQLKKSPVEFQLEVAPVFYGGFFWWWGGFGLEADISLSARYYF